MLCKPEIGDVKSESMVSKTTKTENVLNTVEQKTIYIVNKSSDVIMDHNSDAKMYLRNF